MTVVAVGIAAGATVLAAGAAAYGASQQASAAKSAARTQAASAANANNLQARIFDINRSDQLPYRDTGYAALGQLQGQYLNSGQPDYGGGPPGVTPFPGAPQLQPFTGNVNLEQDPGYQFRLREGMRAIQQSASAAGTLQSGNTLKGLTRFGQDYASQEYGNAYNRAFGENQQQNNIAQQGFGNAIQVNQGQYGRELENYLLNYNRRRGEVGDQYNRLSNLAGLGQTSVGQLGNLGQNYAAQVGQNIIGAGNAQAAGQIGAANATTGLVNNLSGIANQGFNNYLFARNTQNPYGGGYGGGYGAGYQPPPSQAYYLNQNNAPNASGYLGGAV